VSDERCIVYHCAFAGAHDLLLDRQYLGSVCTPHGERIGHGEVERTRGTGADPIRVLYDCYVIDAEKADGWRLVANLSRPNVWTIYAPEHQQVLPINSGKLGHQVRFNEDTGRIEVH
jgi:hypothetical protein